MLYRFFKGATGEHFYTTSVQEGLNAGFSEEGPAFGVLVNQIGDSQGIYRCTAVGFHFVSLDANCEGQKVEGLYGYVLSTEGTNTIPLFRCKKKKDHLVGVGSTSECDNAKYTDEGNILGFAPGPGFVDPN